MRGISIKQPIGMGDALQFSSLPENYFRAKGEKLVDVSRLWFFDHNPFVLRTSDKPSHIQEMWNFSPTQFEWPKPRHSVYLSNAEIWAALFGVPVSLNRPRLYRFEDYLFSDRKKILLQTVGRSHGEMPEYIVRHVLKKYGPTKQLYHIGPGNAYGLHHIETPTEWDLAEHISMARMVICLDSGPAWIGACYPDVIVKKIRTRPTIDQLKSWTPLEIQNIHSHWDDRSQHIFNVSEDDVGFTSTYRKI